jgi:hypothetical protein
VKDKGTVSAANALLNQINLPLLFGVGLAIIGLFRPSLFDRAPWAPGSAVILLTLNIHCYFRRFRKTAGSAQPELPTAKGGA